MAVGPACHRCGNRASLGPGTIRISDMFQFRFFVHLCFVFLLAPFSLSLSLFSSFALSLSLSLNRFLPETLLPFILPYTLSLSPLSIRPNILFFSPFLSIIPFALSFSLACRKYLRVYLEQLYNRNYIIVYIYIYNAEVLRYSLRLLSLSLSPLLFFSLLSLFLSLSLSLSLRERLSACKYASCSKCSLFLKLLEHSDSFLVCVYIYVYMYIYTHTHNSV